MVFAIGLIAGRAEAVTVMLADGQPLIGDKLTPGSGTSELLLHVVGEQPRRLKREDVLAIDFERPQAERLPIAVTLHNGDRISGAVSLGPGTKLTVKRTSGSMAVPLTAMASVRLKPEPPLPAPGARDVVVLANGDRIEGKIEGVAPGRITVRSSLGQTSIDLKRIAGLVMSRRDVVASDDGLRVALELTGGERLSGRWTSLTEDHVGLEVPGLGATPVPLTSVAQLVVLNGRVVFLTDLRAVEAAHVPYLDTQRPHRVNLSQGGRPLQLGGTKYNHGLGVHSRSDLTYELAGKFKQFTAVVGVDDEVGDAGSVLFRVWGDEKVLFESPVMRGGDAPRPIEVDVSGVLLLRLEVDFADDGDLADHADWANARLLR